MARQIRAAAIKPVAALPTRLPPLAQQILMSLGGALLIALAAAVIYSSGLRGAFVFDDRDGINSNPNIRALAEPDPSMRTLEHVRKSMGWRLIEAASAPKDTTVSGRPVSSFSLALNYALSPNEYRRDKDGMTIPIPQRDAFSSPLGKRNIEELVGENAIGYHVLNIIVLVISGLALFGLVRRALLTERLRPYFGRAAFFLALLIALAWVMHPLQTGSVTYIVQRVESIMGMFFLLTMYCALRAANSKYPGWWGLAAVLSAGFGMGSKEVMCTAPLMVIIFDAIFLPGSFRQALGKWKTALPALGLIAAGGVLYALGAKIGLASLNWPAGKAIYAILGTGRPEYLILPPAILLLAYWILREAPDEKLSRDARVVVSLLAVALGVAAVVAITLTLDGSKPLTNGSLVYELRHFLLLLAPLLVVQAVRLFSSGRLMGMFRQRAGMYLGIIMTWYILLALVAAGPRTKSVGFAIEFDAQTSWQYLTTQPGVLLYYIRLSVWPHPMCLDYEWAPVVRSPIPDPTNPTVPKFPPLSELFQSHHWFQWHADQPFDQALSAVCFDQILIPGIVIMLLLGLTVWALFRKPAWGFLGVWFFLILGPTSSFLPIVTEVAAEHRMYLPLASIVCLVILGVYLLGRRLLDNTGDDVRVPVGLGVSGILTICLLVTLGVLTYVRNIAYASELTIWEDCVKKRLTNARARNNFAGALLLRDREKDAEPWLREAIVIKPNYAEAHSNLGVTLGRQGKVHEAIGYYSNAIRYRPDFTAAYVNMAEAMVLVGRNREAIVYYTEARKLNQDPTIMNALAMQLAAGPMELRDGPRAVEQAEKACQMTRFTNMQYVITLAVAYAQAGRYDDAVAWMTRLVKQAQAARQPQQMIDELNRCLQLYQSKQPYQPPPQPTRPPGPPPTATAP